MITDSNQVCFVKMTGRRLQEEVSKKTILICWAALEIPKSVNSLPEPTGATEPREMKVWSSDTNLLAAEKRPEDSRNYNLRIMVRGIFSLLNNSQYKPKSASCLYPYP